MAQHLSKVQDRLGEEPVADWIGVLASVRPPWHMQAARRTADPSITASPSPVNNGRKAYEAGQAAHES
jgi:hypothetical protein